MGTLKIFDNSTFRTRNDDLKALDRLCKKGKKKMEMKVVRCANVINYSCGCLCEYQLIGQFAKVPEGQSPWHIIPCYTHAKNIHEIEEQADKDWEEITSGVKS